MKVDINKLMKYHSEASVDLGAINLCDDEDISSSIEEVMVVNEEVNLEELSLDKTTLELKPLPSSLKYAFLDTQ